MDILNIIQCTNLGGLEQATLRLLEGLKKRGDKVFLLSIHPIGALKKKLNRAQIEYESTTYLGLLGWRSHFQLRKKIREHLSNSLIMTGHNFSGFLALPTAWTGKRVLAMHFHHRGVMPRLFWKVLYWLAMRRFDKVVFVSNFIREEAEDIWPALKSKSATIYNPLPVLKKPLSSERIAAKIKFGYSSREKIVGNAGWLIKRKRFDIFIEVASQLAKRNSKIRFLIAGDGEEKQFLLNLAKKMNVADRIQWVGWLKDMRQFYASLDVMLFNSDWDAFPTTPLEAMSFGVPVVASLKNGGLKEVISHSSYGILLAEHDVDLLSMNVDRLVKDPFLAKSIGKAGRNRVIETCNPRVAVQEYVELLA